MAIGWLTVLKSVPWTDVISNAPKLAEGARKLWQATGGKAGASDQSADSQPVSPEQARIDELTAAVADLHGQMHASSELIKALAEQNAQLVRHIETNRLRIIWFGVVLAAVAGLALVAVVLAWR